MLITERMVAQIKEIGAKRMPHEACGFIVFDSVVELENASKEPRDSFEFNTMQAVAVLQSMGHQNEDLAVWHTHPSGFVGPSRGDLEQRNLTEEVQGLSYLVVSLPNGEAVQY